MFVLLTAAELVGQQQLLWTTSYWGTGLKVFLHYIWTGTNSLHWIQDLVFTDECERPCSIKTKLKTKSFTVLHIVQYFADTQEMIDITRDHSFAQQIFPNSTSLFGKFRGSPRQIFHI